MEQPNETLPRDVVYVGLMTCVQILFGWGYCPLKIWRSEELQNWAWFRTTFNFERKYFWNGWRYRPKTIFAVFEFWLISPLHSFV